MSTLNELCEQLAKGFYEFGALAIIKRRMEGGPEKDDTWALGRLEFLTKHCLDFGTKKDDNSLWCVKNALISVINPIQHEVISEFIHAIDCSNECSKANVIKMTAALKEVNWQTNAWWTKDIRACKKRLEEMAKPK